MNIFFIADNTTEMAQSLHDVHLNKMILETAQILCTNYRQTHIISSEEDVILYKATHINHPATKWGRENTGFLTEYLFNLFDEYKYRKVKTHATDKRLRSYLSFLQGENRISSLPPLCMPDKYKILDNNIESVVKSYRNYYNAEKLYTKSGKFMGKYTKREKPIWLEVKNNDKNM